MLALKQLELLGYRDGAKVFLRQISADGKAQNFSWTLPAAGKLPQKRDLYVVVNGGGNSDRDVLLGRAIWYEHDDKEKSAQLEFWRSLGLPEPTFQVDTGGKSIHSYWTLSVGVAAHDIWRELQSDLLEFADADRTIKNPSRVMRLAGSIHQGTGQQATIVSQSGKRYSYEELRSIVPTQKKQKRKERPLKQPVAVDAIPLTAAIATEHRALIDSGAGEGGRNASGFKLACDLIGAEAWLQSQGIAFDGNAEDLFYFYCGNCSPSLDDKEAAKIWRSATGSNPEPCLSVDKLQKCVEAAQRRAKPKSSAKSAGDAGNAGNDSGDSELHPGDKRPEIPVSSGVVDETARDVLKKLAEAPDPRERIYSQGGSDGYYVARVLTAFDDGRSSHLAVDKDIDTLDVLSQDSLVCELNQRLAFYKQVPGRDGKPQKVAIDCPPALAKHILQMGRWPQLPKLTGVAYHPQLLKNGEIIETPGYDPKTGLLIQYDPSEFAGRPVHPTKADADAALALLRDWLSEFPFQTDIDIAGAIALALTAVVRRTIDTAPLFGISATKRGTGKGALAKNVGVLVTGQKPSSTPYTRDSEEFRKKITSVLRAGSPVINLDNVSDPMGGDVLEIILTEPYFRDRLLGGNQMPSFCTQVVIMANGNNLQFKRDMTRRVIKITLDAEDEFPEHRKFNRDIDEYTLENRGALVNACLTILQAYIQAGSPDLKQPKLGSFNQWSDLVRSAVLWLGMADPVESQKGIDAQDDEKGTLAALLEVWSNTPLLSGSSTVRDVIQQAVQQGSELRQILLDICLGKDGQLSPRLLGYYLRKHHRSVVNGMRLEEDGKDRNHSVKWKVAQVSKKSERPESSPASPALDSQTYIEQGLDHAGDAKSSPAPSNLYPIRDKAKSAGDAGDDSGRSDFSAGDSVRYLGSDPALLNLTGWRGPLVIESANCQSAKVKREDAAVSQTVPLAELEVLP